MRDRYIAMLASRGLKIGDKVVCTYRVPSANQWWTSPFWVGVIQDVSNDGDDTKSSDARYCSVYQNVKVKYLGTEHASHAAGFTQIDGLAHLLPLHWSDELTHSPYFTDGDHEALYAFACKCGLGDYYKVAA